MAKKKDFESSLKRLEEISNQMEKNETTLEKSLNLYKEGVEEAMFCASFLKDMEQEVSILQKDANGIFKTNPFYDMEGY
ncbi:exodeoxyribonuclease VII small subunit [uncultured Tyzzerella sp.]|uniref:exodeoxyribonuclease VII small subunit n=1 Tax=uncultured Tyzzerella sp. TaxID=2321398 RepID=UPI002941E354|nr:exodeoxyribonuclease VII small subunit [uncultured Tyzzerella sp.]